MVTVISALLVILILCAFMMQSGIPLSFSILAMIHMDHPHLFLVDLLPFFIFSFLLRQILSLYLK